MFPRRVEHFTYPPDGKAHCTTDRIDSSPPDSDLDPLKLYDEKGRRWLVQGPPLSAFTGHHEIANGGIYLSAEAMSSLRLRGDPRPQDLIVEGVGGGVRFGYSVDLVEANFEIMKAVIEGHRRLAESVGEVFFFQTVTHTSPNLLTCLRGTGLSRRPQDERKAV